MIFETWNEWQMTHSLGTMAKRKKWELKWNSCLCPSIRSDVWSSSGKFLHSKNSLGHVWTSSDGYLTDTIKPIDNFGDLTIPHGWRRDWTLSDECLHLWNNVREYQWNNGFTLEIPSRFSQWGFLSVHRWSGKCLRSWWGWAAVDELIWPPFPLRFERDDRTVCLSLDGEKHCQSFFTGWTRATWDDVEERSLLQVESDDLIIFEGILGRSDRLSHLDCPFAEEICRMEGRIWDQIDLAKLLISLPIRLPIKWWNVWPSVLLLSAQLPEKKTRSLLDDDFAPCTFLWPNRPYGICLDLCSEGSLRWREDVQWAEEWILLPFLEDQPTHPERRDFSGSYWMREDMSRWISHLWLSWSTEMREICGRRQRVFVPHPSSISSWVSSFNDSMRDFSSSVCSFPFAWLKMKMRMISNVPLLLLDKKTKNIRVWTMCLCPNSSTSCSLKSIQGRIDGSNGGLDDRSHLPCRSTLQIESLGSVAHHRRWSAAATDGPSSPLLSLLSDRLLNDEEKRSLIEHLRADQFFYFVDRLEMRNQLSIATNIDITRRRFQGQYVASTRDFSSTHRSGNRHSIRRTMMFSTELFTIQRSSQWSNPSGRMGMNEWWRGDGQSGGQRGCVADVKDTGRETSGEGTIEMVEQREVEEEKFYRSSKANLPLTHPRSDRRCSHLHLSADPLVRTLSTLFSWNQVSVVSETIHVERRMSS